MGHTRKIALFTAHQAERGILEPIIRRLEILDAERKINFELVQVTVDSQRRSMFELVGFEKGDIPDAVLIPADRREMISAAHFMRLKEIPIFHLWAGVGNTGTEDDMNRRIISSFAYLMLCEDQGSRDRLIRSGEEAWRCIVVGSTHFDDLEVDEELVPRGTYDLIHFNSNLGDLKDERNTLQKVYALLEEDETPAVLINDNETLIKPGATYDRFTHYNRLPRPQFLGLLKNCRRYISNSSATVYEAPYFGVKVVNPGKRNARRKSSFVREPGAADRIVDLLVNYPVDKSKLLKRYP